MAAGLRSVRGPDRGAATQRNTVEGLQLRRGAQFTRQSALMWGNGDYDGTQTGLDTCFGVKS